MSKVIRPLLATMGPDHELRLTFTWDASNPFAVTMDIHATDGPRPRWEFALDLLKAGVSGPAGIGDVHIYPDLPGRMKIVLMPGITQVVFDVPTDEVSSFLAATWVADPPLIPDHPDDIDFGELAW